MYVKALPVVILFGVAACLGVMLGLQYLKGVRSKPVMIGMHLLFGAAGLEVMVMTLAGAPDGTVIFTGTLGRTAAGFLAAALFIGILSPIVGRRSRLTMNVALATHATVASVGVALLLAWVALA